MLQEFKIHTPGLREGRVPIIFLDVDGVLNSHQWWESEARKGDERQAGLDRHIDPQAVLQLQRICTLTGAHVVISSTWRFGHLELLLKMLTRYGFTSPVIGITDRGCSNCVRGNEIYRWLQDNVENYLDFKSYVIIDDDGDMLLSQKDNFVQTASETGGLTSEKADAAITILNTSVPLKT